MKFSVILDILIELLSKRRVTASYLAQKYELSPRTVYRYVELLAKSVPLQIKRGRSGGIYLSDCYTLPVGFLKAEEYDAAIEALSEAYTRSSDTRFLDAKRKLSAQVKRDEKEKALSAETGDILADESALAISDSMAEKLRLMGACIRSLNVVEIEYLEKEEKTIRRIEPHTLVFFGNAVSVYAFCHLKREFTLFRLGRILSAVKTEEFFRKRPFEQAFLPSAPKKLNVRLELEENALERAYDWLGVENIRTRKGKFVADVLLPDSDALISKLLEFGSSAKILSPTSLKSRVAVLAEEINKLNS